MIAALMRFFWMLVGHAVADYPLQGDFLAKAKNKWLPVAGVPWWIAMIAHCLIHAGAVALITHNYWLAVAEFGVHFAIDVAKCAGWTNFTEDQAFHVLCKFIWAYF